MSHLLIFLVAICTVFAIFKAGSVYSVYRKKDHGYDKNEMIRMIEENITAATLLFVVIFLGRAIYLYF